MYVCGMKRAIFHPRLFTAALTGLIGRAPDDQYDHNEGERVFVYRTLNPEDGRTLKNAVQTIKEWLDHFDILFSKSKVNYGVDPIWGAQKGDSLFIHVGFEVDR